MLNNRPNRFFICYFNFCRNAYDKAANLVRQGAAQTEELYFAIEKRPEGERIVAALIRFSGFYPRIDRLHDREEHSRILLYAYPASASMASSIRRCGAIKKADSENEHICIRP